MVELHAGLGAPVEDVGGQRALHERQEALAGRAAVQLAQKVRQHLQRGAVLALFVRPALRGGGGVGGLPFRN